MRTKLLKVTNCETCNEVLITIMRDCNDGDDSITIQAWHYKDDEWWFQIEDITFEHVALLENFINDFSEKSAEDFANSYLF